jgi:hypothetical protein
MKNTAILLAALLMTSTATFAAPQNPAEVRAIELINELPTLTVEEARAKGAVGITWGDITRELAVGMPESRAIAIIGNVPDNASIECQNTKQLPPCRTLTFVSSDGRVGLSLYLTQSRKWFGEKWLVGGWYCHACKQ